VAMSFLPLLEISENEIIQHCVFWVCASSGILKITTFQKLDLFPSSGERMGGTDSVGSMRKS
jgi:hypothetical protein